MITFNRKVWISEQPKLSSFSVVFTLIHLYNQIFFSYPLLEKYIQNSSNVHLIKNTSRVKDTKRLSKGMKWNLFLFHLRWPGFLIISIQVRACPQHGDTEHYVPLWRLSFTPGCPYLPTALPSPAQVCDSPGCDLSCWILPPETLLGDKTDL